MAWCWWEEHVRTLPFVLDLQHTAYGKDDKRISSQCDGFDLLLLLKGTNTDAAYLAEYFKQNKA